MTKKSREENARLKAATPGEKKSIYVHAVPGDHDAYDVKEQEFNNEFLKYIKKES